MAEAAFQTVQVRGWTSKKIPITFKASDNWLAFNESRETAPAWLYGKRAWGEGDPSMDDLLLGFCSLPILARLVLPLSLKGLQEPTLNAGQCLAFTDEAL